MRKRILLTEICRKGKISKENLFYHIVSDVEIKFDKERYPDSVFFFKNNEFLFEQDLKIDRLWCSYFLFWSFFKREFGMKYDEIQSFTKSMVKQHFKIRVSTPKTIKIKKSEKVKQHFKIRVSTPEYIKTFGFGEVKQYFKIKVSTPASSKLF